MRAHLVGGVPKAEVEAKKDLLSAHGLRSEAVFVERDSDYYDFDPIIKERGEIRQRIENAKGVKTKGKKIKQAFDRWWQEYQKVLMALPQSKKLMEARSDLLETFVAEITPVGLLDRFKVAGVIATWWNETQYDLKTLVAQDFDGLVDGWVETIAAALEDARGNRFELADDPLFLRLLPYYLQELDQARQDILKLEQEKEAFEAGENFVDADADTADEEGDRTNYARELKDRIKELRYEIKEDQKQIKTLTGSARTRGSIEFHQAKGDDTAALEEKLKALTAKVRPIEAKIQELEQRLQIESELVLAK